jgi:hypothetical protein
MVSREDEDSGDDDSGSRYDTATYLAHLPDVRPLLEPIGGSTSRASREASGPIEGEGEPGERERDRSGSFSERSYLVQGSARGVGGADPASPIASGSDGGWSSGINVRSQGAVDVHKDPRPNTLGSAKILGCPVSPGTEEHPADRRLNGRAVAGAAGWLEPAGV